MRPEQGFEGYDKGRRGLIIETDLLSGAWMVLFDNTKLVDKANPYEFEYDKPP